MAGDLPVTTSAVEEVSGDSLLGFAIEVRIGNDTITFNTAHLAGLVLLFRDTIGDHARVCTDAKRAHWESL